MNVLNPAFCSVEGVVFDKSQSTLIKCPEGKAGSYAIPESVTRVGDSAFSQCSSLTNVTMGDSVTGIGDSAFYQCFTLTNVTLGNGVTRIGVEVFRSCTGLNGVTLPKSLVSIGNLAFVGCTNLTGVYFEGDAPNFDGIVYGMTTPGSAYYLPGTTGWGSTFGGHPTAPWLPEARTGDADFGVRTARFGFNIRWARDRVVVVETSPDLGNPVWTPVSTNTLTGGSSYFSDPQWTEHPTHFYRVISVTP